MPRLSPPPGGPVSAGHGRAAFLTGGPQVQMGLQQQPAKLTGIGREPFLQPSMIERPGYRAAQPGHHRPEQILRWGE